MVGPTVDYCWNGCPIVGWPTTNTNFEPTAYNSFQGSCIIQQNSTDGPIANNDWPFRYNASIRSTIDSAVSIFFSRPKIH